MRKKVNILDCHVDRVSMEETLAHIETFIREGIPRHVITLNAEIIYRAQQDQGLTEIINQGDLVTPDGSGVVWAANYLGAPVPERVTGIDLALRLAEAAPQKGWTFYLYGGAPSVAEQAAQNLREKHPGLAIVGVSHGYLTEEEQPALLADIKEKKPKILLVALGAPRQEYWIRQHLDELKVPVAIGVGGSLDVIAGKAKRAPVLFQKAGLEWFYRLLREPSRINRMLALPKFSLLVRQKGKKH